MKKETENCLQCEGDRIDLAGDFEKFYLVCRHCGNEGKSSPSIHQANEYWNQCQASFHLSRSMSIDYRIRKQIH